MSRPYQSYFTSSRKSEPGFMTYTHPSKDGARKYPPSRASPASDQTLPGEHVPNGVPWVPKEATQIPPVDIGLAIEATDQELASAWDRSQMIKEVKENLFTPLILTTKQHTKHVSKASERNAPGYPEATFGTAAYGAYTNDTADLGRRSANHSASRAFPGYPPLTPMFPIAPGYPSTYYYGCNSPYMYSSNYFGSPAPDEIPYLSSPVMNTNATSYPSTTHEVNNPDYNRAAPNFPPINSTTLQKKSYPIPTAGRGGTSSCGQTTHHSRPDELPSAAFDPYSTTDTIVLDSRRKAKLKNVSSEDALGDAQRVTERNRSSFPTNGRRCTLSYDQTAYPSRPDELPSAAPDPYYTTDSTSYRKAKLKKHHRWTHLSMLKKSPNATVRLFIPMDVAAPLPTTKRQRS
ncbi:hypothetical protein AZE42_06101 [Rhizopogon vesiculosus]|uniref:Uncharacterized protein n=1 Tax=Rhizopogon vesiculosus TaxID=180088 RepID=A0A1J8QE95_9AGAM|nr:hypothetical protein AZE42_06101 [Rhizopogon vesiculosus]